MLCWLLTIAAAIAIFLFVWKLQSRRLVYYFDNGIVAVGHGIEQPWRACNREEVERLLRAIMVDRTLDDIIMCPHPEQPVFGASIRRDGKKGMSLGHFFDPAGSPNEQLFRAFLARMSWPITEDYSFNDGKCQSISCELPGEIEEVQRKCRLIISDYLGIRENALIYVKGFRFDMPDSESLRWETDFDPLDDILGPVARD